MNMEALYELEKQYELDLIRAEAKVAVIKDIIASSKPVPEYEQTEIAETPDETPNQIY